MRRRHRDAEAGGEEQRDGPARLGAEAADRFELGDALAHGLDDAPAAHERPQAHGGVAGEHHPERDIGFGAQGARNVTRVPRFLTGFGAYLGALVLTFAVH